ncbi:MAG: hypothetical protein ACRDZV_00095 [Acidimicrobiia bacterium]
MARNVFLVAVAAVVVLGAVVFLAGRGTDDGSGAGGLTGGDFHSVVVDPADSSRVFVGGHETVSVSSDGGATWEEVKSLRDADAMGWAFTGAAVYVSGHPGLNRSTDGGRTFDRINEGLPNTDVHAFGGNDEVLYGASPATGVFASTTTPGGWESRTASAGQSFFGRIIVDPDDPDHVFAADASAGVAESSDGGRTWRRVDSGLSSSTWLSRGGEGLDMLVASGPAGAARSTDGGRSWERLVLPDGATLVEAVPGDPDLLYAGIHRGSRVEVQRSRDGGASWSSP